MTIDKMIEVIRKLFNMQNIDTLTLEEMEALSMAIKALKQYGALQEIRQEIEDFEEEVFHEPNTDYKAYASVRYCCDIIDKHIKEIEPQESEDKCKNCEYYRNPDYTRCHKCKAESEDKE